MRSFLGGEGGIGASRRGGSAHIERRGSVCRLPHQTGTLTDLALEIVMIASSPDFRRAALQSVGGNYQIWKMSLGRTENGR